MFSRITSLGMCTLAFSACSIDDAPDEPVVASSEQAVGTAAGIGDVNRDGVVDGADAVQYLSSWGFQIRSYGLTDDTYNTGSILEHRPYDRRVKMYADACLPVGARQYPADQIKGIKDVADAFARLPGQYLRQLGKDHYTLFFVGELGRLAKRWTGSANGIPMNLVFYHSGSGYLGAAQFGPDTGEGYNTEIDQISFSADGMVTFRRPDANQFYQGKVDAVGGLITEGKFKQNGVDYTFDASADYQPAGATAIAGFGADGATSTNCLRDDWAIGRTNPGIVLQSGFTPSTTAAQVGVAVRALVVQGKLGFTPFQQLLEQTFPWTGNAAVACDGCNLVGTGYVTNVAAGVDTPLDFSETFAAWFEDRALLGSRIAQETAAHDSRLFYKKDFLATTIDIPDPGIAVASHPATGAIFRARAYAATQSHPATSIYSGSLLAPTLVNDGSKLWMFTSNANHGLIYSTIDAAGHVSAGTTRSFTNDLPVAATLVAPGKIALFGAADGTVAWRLFDTATGNVSTGNTLHNPATGAPLGVATIGTTTYVIVVAADGGLYYDKLAWNGITLIDTLGSFQPIDTHHPNGETIIATAVTASTVTLPNSPTTISIAAIDTKGAIHYMQFSSTFNVWHADPVDVSAVASPTVDRTNQLYIKGFDGNFYTKPLGANVAYTLVGP